MHGFHSVERERNILFNDTLNTFYLQLYGVRHMVKDHSDSEKGNRCRHIGYAYRLAARVLLYAPSHRQDNTCHSLCYTSRGALAGTRNSSMGPLWGIDLVTHRTMSRRFYHGATAQWVHHEGSIRRPITPRADAFTTELHFAPWLERVMGPPWGIDPMTHRSFLQTNYLCIVTQHYSYTPRTSCLNTIFF